MTKKEAKPIKIDFFLTSLFFFLLGFCISNSITSGILSIAEISGLTIAFTAIIGTIKWKSEAEYKENKNDKKLLIKKIKTFELHCSKLYQRLSLLKAVTKNKGFKDDTWLHISSNIIESSEKIIENADIACKELEIEAYMNSLSNTKHGVSEGIICTTNHAEDFINSSESAFLLSIPLVNSSQREGLNDFLSSAAENSNVEYEKYTKWLVEIEGLLDLTEKSKFKIRTVLDEP